MQLETHHTPIKRVRISGEHRVVLLPADETGHAILSIHRPSDRVPQRIELSAQELVALAVLMKGYDDSQS